MLMMKHAWFIHVPKCGGTSIRAELMRQNLAIGELTPAGELNPNQVKHSGVAHFPQEATAGRTIIASVRDTLSWYQSMWRFRRQVGYDPKHFEPNGPLGPNLWRDEFAAWVDTITTVCPGMFGQILDRLVGEEAVIVRLSHVNEDLSAALNAAGESHGCIQCRQLNSTDRLSDPAEMTPDLVHMIKQSEGDGEYPSCAAMDTGVWNHSA